MFDALNFGTKVFDQLKRRGIAPFLFMRLRQARQSRAWHGAGYPLSLGS